MAVYEAIPARKVIKMRDTYVRMDIGPLATRISGPFNDVSPDEAEQLVLQLVCPSRFRGTALTFSQVTQGDLFAKITHPTDGSATVEFTDDPALYNSSQTIDDLGILAMRMQGMGATLAGLEQALSTHESWLKEVSSSCALSFRCTHVSVGCSSGGEASGCRWQDGRPGGGWREECSGSRK
jgi:hypothetical protein